MGQSYRAILVSFWTQLLNQRHNRGALCQWPLGILSDRLDRRRILAAVALGAELVSVAIVLMGASLSEFSLMVIGALWGGTAFPLYSVAVALTNDHASDDEYVQVSSGLLLLYDSGAVVGPLIATVVMGAIRSSKGDQGRADFSARNISRLTNKSQLATEISGKVHW